MLVLDGFALLQLSATVAACARRDLTIVVFVHYPLSLEPDATPRTRQLCLKQEQASSPMPPGCDPVPVETYVSTR